VATEAPHKFSPRGLDRLRGFFVAQKQHQVVAQQHTPGLAYPPMRDLILMVLVVGVAFIVDVAAVVGWLRGG
jgi:hypothetical protein